MLNIDKFRLIIKNIPNKFIRFEMYEYVLEIFKLNKVDITVKYYDQEFLVYNQIDLKNVLRNYNFFI